MTKFYAKLVREDRGERLLILEASNLPQARREAVEYLSGFWENEARIELYDQDPRRSIPELLWCRIS